MAPDYLLAFLTHDRALKWLEDIETRTDWDHDRALGDTLKEKYESLYVRLVELTHVLIARGANGYFWLIMGQEPASIFDSVAYLESNGEMIEMGSNKVYRLGGLNRRWHIYVDPQMPPDQIIVGAGNRENPLQQYGLIKLQNFILTNYMAPN